MQTQPERRHARTDFLMESVERLFHDMKLCTISPAEANHALRGIAIGLMASANFELTILARDMFFLAEFALVAANMPDQRLPNERTAA